MAIDFMVLAAPRSGTTWAANWLTTDTSICIHDPIMKMTKEDLLTLESPRAIGVSCTGLALFPNWVNSHPAKKVILHRDLGEIDLSLTRIGMTPISEQWRGVLDRIEGVHLDWREMFARPRYMYEYLLDKPFDPERWAILRETNVQPHFESLVVNKQATTRLMADLRGLH